MTKIEFTHDAERDLINIFLYGIEHFGPVQAESYAKTLNARIEMAAEHPDFGTDYGFVVEGVRRYESVSHAIYYRPTQSGCSRPAWPDGSGPSPRMTSSEPDTVS